MARLGGSGFSKNILSLAVISLLLFIPLYPKFPLFNVPGTYVAVRVEDLWVAAVFIIWFYLERKQGFITFKERTSRLILLYFLAGAVSLLSALLVTKTVTPHLGFLHFLRRIEYMSLFFVVLAAVKNKHNVASFVGVLFLSTIGVFIFGLGQKYFAWPVISTMNAEFSKGITLFLTQWTRINATFAGHYDLAAFSVLLFCLALGFIIGVKRKKLKALGIVIAFLAFYLLLLTASRVSFGAYLLTVVLILVLAKKKLWIIPLVSLSLVAMFLSGDLGQRYAATFDVDLSFLSARLASSRGGKEVALAPTPTPVQAVVPVSEAPGGLVIPGQASPSPEEKKITIPASRFPEPESVEIAAQRSGEIRFKVEWPRALRAFVKNPLLGTGYSSVTLATDNDYLRSLAETGLLGTVALLAVFLEIFRRLSLYLKKAKPSLKRALVIGIGGGVFGFLGNALFIDVLESSKVAFVFWMLVGLMIGVIKLEQKDEPI